MSETKPIKVSVVAVVERGDRILLGKRLKKDAGEDLWVLPGGGIEGEESFEQAVQREVREEVGLEVRLGTFIAATRSAHAGKNNVALVFWAHPVNLDDEPKSSDEIGTPGFFTLDEARSMNVMPVTHDVFRAIDRTMNVSALLAHGRAIWGDERLDLSQILIRNLKTMGDLAKIARGATKDLGESNKAQELEVKKELGNLIFSTIRFCDDLGLSPQDCIREAVKAQRRFAAQNPQR